MRFVRGCVAAKREGRLNIVPPNSRIKDTHEKRISTMADRRAAYKAQRRVTRTDGKMTNLSCVFPLRSARWRMRVRIQLPSWVTRIQPRICKLPRASLRLNPHAGEDEAFWLLHRRLIRRRGVTLLKSRNFREKWLIKETLFDLIFLKINCRRILETYWFTVSLIRSFFLYRASLNS